MTFQHHVAIGDPQVPLQTLLDVLEHHHLLGETGLLRADVQLVSLGDHFDYGGVSQRDDAARNGTALLSWLSAHPPEQVVLLLGNHDVARVCELAPFADDEPFLVAWRRARAAYRDGNVDRDAQAALLKDYPFVPDAECLARDFAGFETAQRRLVDVLLRDARFRLAHAHRGLLLVHAGVTTDDFASLGLSPTTAEDAAQGLNAFLDEKVAAWTVGPLDLTPFHQAGSAATSGGRGALFHRPADPARARPGELEGPPRRRFDPRTLPEAFPQAIGHIRDDKCRDLMQRWCEPTAAGDGPLRSLRVAGDVVEYRAGCLEDARLLFLDGGMFYTRLEPSRYQLLDLDRRQPLQPLPPQGRR